MSGYVGSKRSSSLVSFDEGTIGSGVVFPTFVGMIASFAMSSAPTGWLVCDGAEISRATYANLFNTIGTTWGAGDESTTFALPDLRGMFLRGHGIAQGSGNIGEFQAMSVQKHSHYFGYWYGSRADGIAPIGWYGNGNSTEDYGSYNSNGEANVDETRPKNYAILYCIKY